MSSVYLLLPLLLPVLAAFSAFRKADRKKLIILMCLEFLLVLSGCFCKGSFAIPCLPGMKLLFRADGISRIFSVLFSAMFLLVLHRKLQHLLLA